MSVVSYISTWSDYLLLFWFLKVIIFLTTEIKLTNDWHRLMTFFNFAYVKDKSDRLTLWEIKVITFLTTGIKVTNEWHQLMTFFNFTSVKDKCDRLALWEIKWLFTLFFFGRIYSFFIRETTISFFGKDYDFFYCKIVTCV